MQRKLSTTARQKNLQRQTVANVTVTNKLQLLTQGFEIAWETHQQHQETSSQQHHRSLGGQCIRAKELNR